MARRRTEAYAHRHGDGLISRDESSAERPHFGEARIALLTLDCLNGVADYFHRSAALEQAFDRAAHTEFGDHAEDDVFDVRTESLNQFARMRIREYVERLLFENDLLVSREIDGQFE